MIEMILDLDNHAFDRDISKVKNLNAENAKRNRREPQRAKN